MNIMEELLAIYDRCGAQSYFGEPVTVIEHCLQCAHLASSAAAPPALIAAALLHDVGHLIESAPEDLCEWTIDAGHESSGADWLAARFGPAVSEPVRLHVAAKRYLCSIDGDYARQLSAASVKTLQLQGGLLSGGEIAEFEKQTYRHEAVRLRRWDDAAKIAGLSTPEFRHYAALLQSLAIAP